MRLTFSRGGFHSHWLLAWAILIGAQAPSAAQVERPLEPQWELWKIGADGSGGARFADTPGYSCGSPKWSPDGTMVAYDTRAIEEDLYASQVAVIRADGTGRQLLGPGSMPSFSPDGTQLVFHTYNPSSIAVMNADGTGRETISDHFGSPRWMPNGNCIALIGSGRNIVLFDLTTGKERSILSGPHSLRPGFAVSADGARICFADTDGGLVLATYDERMLQTSVRWLVSGGAVYHASWAPDNKRVIFSWDCPSGWFNPLDVLLALMTTGSLISPPDKSQLYVLDVDSNQPPRWLPGQPRLRRNVNPDWSPDGKTIIFSSQRL